MDNLAIVERIKGLRLKARLSMRALSRMIGKSGACLCYIEKGTRNPSRKTLEAIARAFNISVEELISGERAPDANVEVTQEGIGFFLMSQLDSFSFSDGKLIGTEYFERITFGGDIPEEAKTAILVEDDAMRPEFDKGDIIVIDLRYSSHTNPEEGLKGLHPDLKTGDYVICEPVDVLDEWYFYERLHNPNVVLRKILFDKNDECNVSLLASNPTFEVITLNVKQEFENGPSDFLAVVGKVIGKFKRYE